MVNKQRNGDGEGEGYCDDDGYCSGCGAYDEICDGGGAVIGDAGRRGRSFLHHNEDGKNSGPWVLGYGAKNGVCR